MKCSSFKFLVSAVVGAWASAVATNAYAVTAAYPQAFNYDFQYGGTQPDWGMPGVDAGLTPYLGSAPAYGFVVSFTGEGPILPGSVQLGNASACTGSTGGGTTFCTGGDIWQAFQTGPDTIQFLAQSPAYYLAPGADFFVNVFFSSDPPGPTATFSFNPDFDPTPTPLPSAFWLFATALAGLVGYAWRRKIYREIPLTDNFSLC
jgi:hypothetical protein